MRWSRRYCLANALPGYLRSPTKPTHFKVQELFEIIDKSGCADKDPIKAAWYVALGIAFDVRKTARYSELLAVLSVLQPQSDNLEDALVEVGRKLHHLRSSLGVFGFQGVCSRA